MPTPRLEFAPAGGGSVRVDLQGEAREIVAELTADYRTMLLSESQASDPAVARLFPPAYREDPLRNFDYERQAHDGLLGARLAAIDAVERSVRDETLTADDARAWLGVLNDLRLVLGTRLDITEETDRRDFSEDPSAQGAFELYGWLTYLTGTLLEALDPSLADIGTNGPPPEDPES